MKTKVIVTLVVIAVIITAVYFYRKNKVASTTVKLTK